MKKLIILSIIILNMSCSKDDKSGNNAVVNAVVEFSILNQIDEDLLNSSKQGYFSFDKMKLYYLINGKK